MTHYRMSYNLPSASILSRNQMSSSFDESRIYNENIVYMENKQEFSIKLFNPLHKKIGVQIGLNGEFSKHLVILRPGEDITIDRFIDNSSKMLFETYNYDSNNEAASNAVANNGIVDINFFNEKKIDNRMYFNTTISSGNYNLDNGFTTFSQSNSNSRIYNSDTYSTLCNTNGMGNVSNTSSFDNGKHDGSGNGNGKHDGSGNGNGKHDGSGNGNGKHDGSGIPKRENKRRRISKTNASEKWSPIIEKNKETGMVSKGNESEQIFEQVNTDFETISFHSLKFYIKPNSEKPYENIDIREYCPQCSYRIRNKKWNFCPKCGSNV